MFGLALIEKLNASFSYTLAQNTCIQIYRDVLYNSPGLPAGGKDGNYGKTFISVRACLYRARSGS